MDQVVFFNVENLRVFVPEVSPAELAFERQLELRPVSQNPFLGRRAFELFLHFPIFKQTELSSFGVKQINYGCAYMSSLVM